MNGAASMTALARILRRNGMPMGPATRDVMIVVKDSVGMPFPASFAQKRDSHIAVCAIDNERSSKAARRSLH